MASPSRQKATPEPPVFSERLAAFLEEYRAGRAPNVGRFCGYCYTPIDQQRERCAHCDRPVAQYPPVAGVPAEVREMFRRLRRRESLVVNGFAYLGLFSGVFIFLAIIYVLFLVNAGIWWYVADIVLLFVLARALAGIVGGFVGDELGYRYGRRKLAKEWHAYEREQAATPP